MISPDPARSTHSLLIVHPRPHLRRRGGGRGPLQDDLARLRAGALTRLGWVTGSIGYGCLILLIWPVTGAHAPGASWLGTAALAGASLLAILGSRRRPRLARYGFGVGVHGAAACGMLALARPEGAYLFLLPVIFASVIFNRWLALANALLALTLIALLNRYGLGGTLWAVTPLLSSAITALAAISAWLAAHNLYTALTWLSSAYAQAHLNETLARERQAELQRVLKALDEAHYRLRRLNGLLAVARDQAEEGRRVKQYFAQTISHELRTPLNLVVGFAELMVESPEYYGAALPPAYLRDLRIVYRNAHHLQGLVNDVLDLARIDAAQMSLICDRVDAGALVAEAVETVRGLVEARGLTLTTRIAPALPPIWLDATRVRQVLINLFNNAVRFTVQGGVTVSLTQHGDELRFAVSDTGPGIAPADLARIFDEFYQVDGGSNRRQEGAGLGLAISRKFVALHGGRLWADSVLGQGSTFTFALPLRPTPDLPAASPQSPGWAGVAADVTAAGRDEERVLLVVTNSTPAVGLLSRHFPRARVLATGDLAQAHTLARQLTPQVLLIDSRWLALDAQQLAEIGQEWGLSQASLITCPLPGEASLRRRLAVDAYLIKPIVRQNLWDVVRSFGDSVEQLLIVDDNRDFVRLLRQMLANPLRPLRVESAYSGVEALARLRLSPPDLILLDLGLPDLSGAQVVETLRAHPVWRSIPVVVVTAQDELDGLEVLPGAFTVTKAGGLLPGDLVHWLEAITHGPPPPAPSPRPA